MTNNSVDPDEPESLYPTIEYMGHTISLTDDLFFRVRGPEYDSVDALFESRRSALRDIEIRVYESTVARTYGFDPRNEVISLNGRRFYITRINPATGRIGGLDNFIHVYPSTHYTQDLIDFRCLLQVKLDESLARLAKIEISTQRYQGRIPEHDRLYLARKLNIELREKHAWAAKQAQIKKAL